MKAPRRGLIARTAFLLLLVACGSRTGLFGTEDGVNNLLPDGGPIPPGFDGGFLDGPPGFDGAFEPDAPLPPIDAAPRPDANRNDCPDADATLVYVVTEANELYSFFPTDGTFTFISNLTCPVSDPQFTPFSMAVDRRGVAYVEFTDDRLYRVSTATGACIGTSFQPDQQAFTQFGMGFATNTVGPTETLFVAGTPPTDNMGNVTGPSPGLGSVDPMTFVLSKVGNFLPDIQNAELTGTGDGRLFAFYNKNNDPQSGNPPPSFIGEIDTTNAHVIAETPFPTVGQGTGWAFAFWGGDFYMFTSATQASGSDVTRWRPSDNSVSVVTSLPSKIVGAGVSTCAPAQ